MSNSGDTKMWTVEYSPKYFYITEVLWFGESLYICVWTFRHEPY